MGRPPQNDRYCRRYRIAPLCATYVQGFGTDLPATVPKKLTASAKVAKRLLEEYCTGFQRKSSGERIFVLGFMEFVRQDNLSRLKALRQKMWFRCGCEQGVGSAYADPTPCYCGNLLCCLQGVISFLIDLLFIAVQSRSQCPRPFHSCGHCWPRQSDRTPNGCERHPRTNANPPNAGSQNSHLHADPASG